MKQFLLPGRFPGWLTPLNISWFGTLAAVVSLSTSKAVLSIATAVIVLGALLEGIRVGKDLRIRREAWWMAALWGLVFLDAFFAEAGTPWTKHLWSKLPFLLLGLSYGLLPAFRPVQHYTLLGGFVLTQAVIALLSLGYFFRDYELAMGRLSRNAHIDIAGNISHIYFGLLLSFSIFAAIWLWRSRVRIFGQWEKWLWVGLSGFLFLALHLLTARTGLLSFYVAAGISLVVFGIRKKAWLLGSLCLMGLILTPIISFYAVPSFRLKLEASWWDLQGYQQADRDLSHHSASLRLVAYEAAWKVFAAHPLRGSGISQVEKHMAQQYAQMDIRADVSQLPTNPHNQYLEYLVAYGIVGGSLLLIVCLGPFWKRNQANLPLLFISFVAMYMTAMLVESLLERQIGIYFFVTFMMLLPALPQSDS